MHSVIIIVGPTASGKSDVGVEVARAIDGEVISADSRQVYRGLDLGTGKITTAEMRGVLHHMLDIASPKEMFTANDFVTQGRVAIADIHARGKTPIIVGGTGFYIDALLGRIALAEVPPNAALRAELAKKTTAELFTTLLTLDPHRAEAMDTPSERNNSVRLVRAIEIASSATAVAHVQSPTYYAQWYGITVDDITLRERIITRLHKRIEVGMIREAQQLHAEGLSYGRMEELGLEYRYLAQLLQDKMTREEFESKLATAIYQYAKRQKTYWKRNKEIVWKTRDELASQILADFY